MPKLFPSIAIVVTVVLLTTKPSYARTEMPRSTSERFEVEAISPTAKIIPTRIQERAELHQDRLEARTTVAQERQEERTTERQERRSNFAQQHADRIERRFDLYAEHLLNIASRIETRAQTMSNNGKNTSDALAKVTEARTFITSAQAKGEEAVSKFRTIDPATYDTQREIALAARDLAEAGREDFKAAHDLLHEAVQMLASNKQQSEGE